MTADLDVKKRVNPADKNPQLPSKHVGKIPLNRYQRKGGGSHFPQKEKQVVMFLLEMWGPGVYTVQGRDESGRISTVWRGTILDRDSSVKVKTKKNLLEKEGIEQESRSKSRYVIKNPRRYISPEVVKSEMERQRKKKK